MHEESQQVESGTDADDVLEFLGVDDDAAVEFELLLPEPLESAFDHLKDEFLLAIIE